MNTSRTSTHRPSTAAAVAVLAAGSIFVVGCSSSGGSPGVTSSSGSSSATSGGSSTSSSASSTSSSTPSSSAAASSYTTGQKIGAGTLQNRIKAAIVKAGGTYSSTTTSSVLTSTSQSKITGARTDATVHEVIRGKKVTVIIVDGVAYISGTGLGTKPYLKVTKNSTGTLAESFKPLLNLAGGGSLSNAEQWTVASSSASGTTLTASPAAGTNVTDTLDAKGLPVSTVTKAATGTSTIKYYDFGKPVTITVPPASQVADISGVQST
ncbi:hypothetical protein [Allobranchiibius sp. GilTou38]|uniref:hypothetical protein n=1 Tax=Allobranchiibius sp. GilTou38 TaxID=2815210 RepID=UPI001AA0F889|nr:hypothetical protein [Allobranchiibius sp. GilTou38]MBO1767805.1 hypothetical protein [Allobranchiibius sp. GilTou38]